jgi:two-component system C4-dicarboxylate transport sensor histidine kinase DctB
MKWLLLININILIAQPQKFGQVLALTKISKVSILAHRVQAAKSLDMWPTNHPLRLRWAMASLLAALLIAALAYVVTERRGMAQEMATARTDLAMRQALITSEIARFRLLPIALADDRDVTSALAGNLGARDALNRKLEALVTATGAPIIYVIGQDGKAIAASNWRSPQSFVGADYSARRYFRDALKMGGASHFAMGTVSHRPGLYIAQRTAQGGVVAIKLEFDRIEAAWAKGDGATFVTEKTVLCWFPAVRNGVFS